MGIFRPDDPQEGVRKVAMKQRIVFNGIEYGHPDEMPPDVRADFQRVMDLLADRNADGIPDILEEGADASVHVETRVSADVSRLTPGNRTTDRHRTGGEWPLLAGHSLNAASVRHEKPFRPDRSFSVRVVINRGLFYLLIALLGLLIFFAWPR
jgi:hypothetical protein